MMQAYVNPLKYSQDIVFRDFMYSYMIFNSTIKELYVHASVLNYVF